MCEVKREIVHNSNSSLLQRSGHVLLGMLPARLVNNAEMNSEVSELQVRKSDSYTQSRADDLNANISHFSISSSSPDVFSFWQGPL